MNIPAKNKAPKTYNGVEPEELISLMREVSGGCEKAFNKIFDTFYNPIVSSIISKYRLSSEIAEDLANEVMTKVWEKASHYDPSRGHVTTWVFTIMELHFIDYYRREQSKKSLFAIYELIHMDFVLLKSEYQLSELSETPEEICINNERAEYIDRLFDKSIIGETLLKVMELRYLSELSLKEIAKKLKMNDSTVRVNLKRGREKIQNFVNSNNELSFALSL